MQDNEKRMRVLCVAEKPSAAKAIASILSQSSYTIVNTPLFLYVCVCIYHRLTFFICKRDQQEMIMLKIMTLPTTFLQDLQVLS